MRIIALDTETTGLNPHQGDKIIEIGCVELKGRKITGHTWHCYLQPDKEMTDEVIQIHGITNEFLQGKPRFVDVCAEFLAFIKGTKLVIHNAEFDLKFINYEFSQVQNAAYEEVTNYCEIVDTLQMARKMHPGQRNTLDSLCKRYNVDNSARDKHGALIDANLLAQVYLAMTGGQASLSIADADQFSATNFGALANISAQNLANLPPTKIMYASAEELDSHHEFMQKMRDKKIKLDTA